MTIRNVHTERLAEALTSLLNFVPETAEDLARWYDKAQCILENPSLLKGAPHFLWHYLADADIRMKDPAYADMQRRRVEQVLQCLRRGEMPTDEDTELSEQSL